MYDFIVYVMKTNESIEKGIYIFLIKNNLL